MRHRTALHGSSGGAAAMDAAPLNASSIHALGRKAKKIIEEAKTNILKAFDAEDAEIIFTSGGTEANNLAISGHDKILVSAIEHPSVLKPAKGAQSRTLFRSLRMIK